MAYFGHFLKVLTKQNIKYLPSPSILWINIKFFNNLQNILKYVNKILLLKLMDMGQKIIFLLIFGLKQKIVGNFMVFLKTFHGLTAKNIISGFYKKIFYFAYLKKTLSNYYTNN